MWNLPDLSGLFWLAMVGAGAIVITTVGTIGWLLWFIIFHVRIV